MGVIGTMALLAVPAFLLGIMAGLIYNYMALRKWRRETQPRKQRWYHTWSRH